MEDDQETQGKSARVLQGFHGYLCGLDFYEDLADEYVMNGFSQSDENYKQNLEKQSLDK